MVTVLGVLAALAVLFAAAVVATRPGGELVPAERDRPDLDLPEDGLVPEDLHRVRFGLALRGYRMAEVDRTLDRAADALAHEQERVRRLEAALLEAGLLEAGPLRGPVSPPPVPPTPAA